MSLKFVQDNPFKGKPHRIIDLEPNEGPKHGVGAGPINPILRLPPQCRMNGLGPKRGIGKFTGDTSEIRNPIQPSRVVSKEPPRVDFSSNLQPHKGPKRGFGYGPGTTDNLPGPKRGHGAGPGIDPLSLFETGSSQDEQLCVRLTNEFRQKQGKPPLKFMKKLSEIGMPHTKNMLARKIPVGHIGFDERARQIAGYAAAENVAYCQGYSDPIRIFVQGWINSPGHRRNLLGDYTHMGIAVAHDGDAWYGTQLFARY